MTGTGPRGQRPTKRGRRDVAMRARNLRAPPTNRLHRAGFGSRFLFFSPRADYIEKHPPGVPAMPSTAKRGTLIRHASPGDYNQSGGLANVGIVNAFTGRFPFAGL